MLLLLLALLSGLPPDTRGQIHVRVEPGVTILLDGQQVGVSNDRDGGLWIRAVRPGKHTLLLQLASGASLDVNAEVVAGQTTTLPISSLTLRASTRKRKSDMEVRVDSEAPQCSVSYDDRYEPLTGTRSVVLRDLSSGSRMLEVFCGGRTLKKTVNIVAGRYLVVEASFQANEIRIVNDRPRVKELVVKSSRDILVDANIPTDTKRLLLAALRPGIEVLGVTDRGSRLFVRLEAESQSPIEAVATAVKRSPEVKKVETFLIEEIENPKRVRVDLVLTWNYGGAP
jgi:hypothetical protein